MNPYEVVLALVSVALLGAAFGVRGIGSLHYLAFATSHAECGRIEAVWSMVVLVVLLSILLHGISAKRAMRWLAWKAGGRGAVECVARGRRAVSGPSWTKVAKNIASCAALANT